VRKATPPPIKALPLSSAVTYDKMCRGHADVRTYKNADFDAEVKYWIGYGKDTTTWVGYVRSAG